MRFVVLSLFLLFILGCQSNTPVPPSEDTLTFVEECDAQTPCPIGTCVYPPEDNLNAICVADDPCTLCDSGSCILAKSNPPRVVCQ